MLKQLLAHPLTRGMNLDAPETTALRKRIVREKPFLRRIYDEWYRTMSAWLPDLPGASLEIGSGAGHLAEYVPGLITSDVFPLPEVDRVIDATQMPFDDDSLRAIFMTNVFHHVARSRDFLDEAVRCLKPGGRIIMLEPWMTPFSRIIYATLHHEPFDRHAREWSFPSEGPLSDANGALPWIVFHRDREIFLRDYPQFRIVAVRRTMPFRYLVSGGISMRNLMPGWTFGMWRAMEWAMQPLSRLTAMFAYIVVEKNK